ncbi:hypothetical protein QQP08_023897 [Theobroma cacao]|nr:hypothetical protein QQP08_023897 [Theobroma cacao]
MAPCLPFYQIQVSVEVKPRFSVNCLIGYLFRSQSTIFGVWNSKRTKEPVPFEQLEESTPLIYNSLSGHLKALRTTLGGESFNKEKYFGEHDFHTVGST